MRMLAFLLGASRGLVATSIAAGAVAGASSVALIALLHMELARAGPVSSRLAWAFAGLCLVAGPARVAAQAAMVRLGQDSAANLRLQLCERALALPPARFEEVEPAALLGALTEDIAIVSQATIGLPLIAINLPIVAACLAYVGWLSPPVLACSLAVAIPAVVGYLALAGRGQRRLEIGRSEQDGLTTHLRALIEGFRELKLHRGRRAAFFAAGLRPAAESVRDHNTAGLTLFAAAAGWSQLALFGVLGLLLFALPRWADLDRPALTGAVLAALFIMTPLDVLLTWFPAFGRARAALRTIETVLPRPGDAGEEDALAVAGLTRPPLLRESIELAGVTYAYRREPEGDGFVLGPLDLVLRPGELVILAGGNGSGKTTLVKLLSGLYRPSSGTVLLDGRPIGPRDLEAQRQLFSVVFADGYLFRSLLGLDLAGRGTEAQRLLGRMGLGDRVRIEGGAFSTVDLSVGQRRRLALLSALLEDRPGCIFDEWAANQDVHFKQFFYADLLPELRAQGKALLVISHDEEYYEIADRVIRLRDGLILDEERDATGRDVARAGVANRAEITP